MPEVQELAEFVERARLPDLSEEAAEQLKIRVLDTVGVAIAALAGPPIVAIRELIAELGGRPLATLIGGGKTAPDRAAFFNGALSRYLDFMDSYIAAGETCHPSDNVGAVLAAAEMRNASGADFLVALAVAYQVQTQLSDALRYGTKASTTPCRARTRQRPASPKRSVCRASKSPMPSPSAVLPITRCA